MKYKYIVIEGIDGSGKTTIANMLKEYLEKKGYKVFLTKEPFNKEIKDIIKKITEEKKYTYEYGYAIASLFTADRFLHNKLIKEYLNEGYIVISDRAYHSTFCYQSIYEGFDIDWLKNLIKPLLKPDIVIVLDVSVENAIKRIERERSDRFPYEEYEILKKVREKYLNLKKILPDENIYIVNNDRDINETFKEILSLLSL